MIEIKSKTHIQRLYATALQYSDIFKAVYYAGYRGDENKIPFWYSVKKGETCESDLTLTMEQLFALMKKNTRYEIRRAEKEGCTFEVGKDLSSFIPYYNAFCNSKGLDDQVDISRLTKYTGDNDVLITKVIYNQQVLSMHATVFNNKEKIAFLLLSGSQRLDAGVDCKLVGWGNRYLHYKDLEYLKSIGIEKYDWSGIVTDPNDKRYSIGQFKLSFGGKIIPSLVLKTPLFLLMSIIRPLIVRLRH